MSYLLDEIKASAVEVVADIVHDVYAGGPGSGRRPGFGWKVHPAYKKGIAEGHLVKSKRLLSSLKPRENLAKKDMDFVRKLAEELRSGKAKNLDMFLVEKNGDILDGHHRMMALKRAFPGITTDKIPVLVQVSKNVDYSEDRGEYEEQRGGGKNKGGKQSGNIDPAEAYKELLRKFPHLKDLEAGGPGQKHAPGFDPKFLEDLESAAATYPKDHKAGMRVPKGGSSCASCEYLADNKTDCTSTYFQKWNGSPVIPGPIDEYCSDWYEQTKKVEASTETSQKGRFAGTLWNGIRLIGFTGPEEENLKAMLSRIPPELFFNVKRIRSAKELNVKHGRFIPETKTVQYNPKNFTFRQRFGKGDGWIWHSELTAVHEIGHSVYDAMTPEKKSKWQACSDWVEGWKEGNAPVYVEVRPGWPQETSKWTHKAGIKFPRHYSEKNPNEDFSDCFAFYIMNKGHQMEPEKKFFLDNLIKDNVKHYPSASIQSPMKSV